MIKKKIFAIKAFIILAGMSCLFLSGCMPESDQPLSDPKDAVIDQRLLGVWLWIGEDESEGGLSFMHFVANNQQIIDVVIVGHPVSDGASVSGYKVFTTTSGSQNYLNIKEWSPEKDEVSKNYMFARYEISGQDILTIWVMEGLDTIIEAIEAGRLKGRIEKGRYISDATITDNSVKIIEFIQGANQQELFGEGSHFRKLQLP